MDQDDADDAICARAAIHMFGHKHRQRITREAAYVRFGAAAVNPNPNEPGWQPGYNLVDMQGDWRREGAEALDCCTPPPAAVEPRSVPGNADPPGRRGLSTLDPVSRTAAYLCASKALGAHSGHVRH